MSYTASKLAIIEAEHVSAKVQDEKNNSQDPDLAMAKAAIDANTIKDEDDEVSLATNPS